MRKGAAALGATPKRASHAGANPSGADASLSAAATRRALLRAPSVRTRRRSERSDCADAGRGEYYHDGNNSNTSKCRNYRTGYQCATRDDWRVLRCAS